MVAAWSEVSTSCATGSFACFLSPAWIVSIARGSFPKIDPSMRLPPSANEAYARAISSGVAGSAPSPIAK